MVVLDNGVHIILRDLVEHLFAESGDWLVYRKVYLPDIDKPLYVVAYHTKGYDEPIVLLTNMVVAHRMPYGRRYGSMQGLIFLASLAMGFLSYLRKSACPLGDALRRSPED